MLSLGTNILSHGEINSGSNTLLIRFMD